MAAPSAPVFSLQPLEAYYSEPVNIVLKTQSDESVTSCTARLVDASTSAQVGTLTVVRRGSIFWTSQFTPSEAGLSIGENYYIEAIASNGDGNSQPATSTVFPVQPMPTVTITSPANGAVLRGFPIDIEWEYGNRQPFSTTLSITANGSTMELDVPWDTTSYTLEQLDVSDGDNITFCIETKYTHITSQISDSVSATFYFPVTPGAPTASISYDEHLSASITVGYGTDTETATVIRYIGDGEDQWVVASNVADGATVTDPLPPLGVDYAYAVVSYSADGVPLYTMFPARIDTTCWAFNCGPQAAIASTFKYNPQQTRTVTHGGDMYHFADGGMGRGLPVFYETTDRDMSGTLRFDSKDREEAEGIIGQSSHWPLMWIRDPYGNRWYAHVVFTIAHGIGKVWDVQASWDAVRWTEAWDG